MIYVIQARMGSTRLPGKVLKDVGGKPVLDRVLSTAVELSENPYQRIYLITSSLPEDDVLEAWALQNGVPCSRRLNEPLHVYEWFYQLGLEIGFDHTFVRISGDCPFINPAWSRKLLIVADQFRGADYYGYSFSGNVPAVISTQGVFVEAFSGQALKRGLEDAVNNPAFNEHVTNTFYLQPDKFRCVFLPWPFERYRFKLSLDTEKERNQLSRFALSREHTDYSCAQKVCPVDEVIKRYEWYVPNS